MRFIVALVVSFALVWACAKPLKKHPVPFYVGAVALVVLYFCCLLYTSDAADD